MDRGVVLTEPGRVAVEEIELEPPGAAEVLVRLTACGVCHSDVHIVEEDGWGHRLPVLLGHEGAGVVESVGEGVESLRAGDRVVLGWRAPCGTCRWCLRGDARRCRTPASARRRLRLRDGRRLTHALRMGGFATRTIVHERAAVRVPEELPAEQACLIGCAVVTGVGSVRHTASVWPGARVGVIGCGAVGISVVQGARLAGAAEIHALDLDETKLDAARRFGATHIGPGEELDFVFDAVGRTETIAQAVGMIGHAGTIVLIGIPAGGTQAAFDLVRFFDFRGRLLVSHGGDHLPAEDFPLLARLALDGRLDLAGMVTRRIELDEVPAALADVGGGGTIRTVARLEREVLPPVTGVE